jgi:peptidyl-prolyl cis-trans isomerase B (cyclophilin B)
MPSKSNPLFPALRSGPTTAPGAIRQKQIPSSGKHTVFGEVTKGQDVINSIKGGDTIESITIHDSTDELFETHKDRIAEWSK